MATAHYQRNNTANPTNVWTLCAGALFVAAMFVAFSRTFYLKALFPETDAITLLVAAHGTVMTGGALLVAVQSSLIFARRTHWHRQLGIVGVFWGALVVIMGTLMTVHATARDVRTHDPHAALTIQVLALELVQMAMFAGFVAAGYALRRRLDFHRRLMMFTLAKAWP